MTWRDPFRSVEDSGERFPAGDWRDPLRFTDHGELDERPLPPVRKFSYWVPINVREERLNNLSDLAIGEAQGGAIGRAMADQARRNLAALDEIENVSPRPLPPSQPPGWIDPDPLHVEPEPVIRRPYAGWELDPKPTPHWFAWFGLGICIGIVVFALIFTIGRAVDAASRSGQTTEPVDLSGPSSAALSGAPHSPGPTAEGSRPSAGTGGAPSPTGVATSVVTASATWCAPTATQCQAWGGIAKLAAVNSFHDGDEPYLVRVSRAGRSVTVLVVSYCACRGTDRAIDLSPAAFEILAPLSRGRVDVVLEWPVPEPPRTDADLRMQREVLDDGLYR